MRWNVFLRYLAAGLFIGGFWYLNRGRPPYEEALRTVFVFTLWLIILRRRLRRASIELRLFPALASKAGLVIAAALAETTLAGFVENPALPVAIGLGLTVSLLDPLCDRHFFARLAPVPIR